MRKSYVWLIGGTTESATIAQLLAVQEIPTIITVTTPNSVALYPQIPLFQVMVGKMDLSQITLFLRQQQIIAVVDASHPFATAISQNAMAATKELNIPYLRYERPKIDIIEDGIIRLDSFNTLLAGDYLQQQRVLLTIGYQALPQFQPWQHRATLFTRILPSQESLEVAIQAGFTNHRIIAIRPPLQRELEKALWQQWQISLVVTKASGVAGGQEIKQSVARELGIPLIVINRPKISYPRQTSLLDAVLQFCCQFYS